MRSTPRRLVVVFAAVCALVMIAGPAQATAPTKEVIEDAGIASLGTINCHGFKLVEETIDETLTITTYYDDAGNAIKVTLKFNFFGVITNTKTGESFRDHVSFLETDDLIADTTTLTGSTYHFVESGEGAIYTEGGKKIIVNEDGSVVFASGPNDFGAGGYDALCDALA